MSKTSTLFGLDENNRRIMRLARTLSIFLPVVSVAITLSSTFTVIFVAEALGAGDFISGMSLVGILLVVQMTVQIALDYPTGAIGDWIGQRYIICCAFLSFGIAFLLLSLVTTSTHFLLLVLIYVLIGLGSSQMSGSFQAWFDNNFRVAIGEEDHDRKQYGMFWGRIGMLFQIVATLTIVPGAVIATIMGRPFVFQLQAVLCLIIAISALFFIRDFKEVEDERPERPSMSEYKNILVGGLSFLYNDKYVFHIVLGSCFIMSTITVWGNLILFPMYFSYLVTDIAVSSYRTILFIPGVVAQERSGIWSKRFDPRTWIPRFRALQLGGVLFFLAIAMIMFLFPPPSNVDNMVHLIFPGTDFVIMSIPDESVIPVILMTIVFSSTSFFGGFAEILTQRILLDAIPNKIRNSMYSLTPTIGTILALPQIAFFGWALPALGFPLTLLMVSAIAAVGVMQLKKGLGLPVQRDNEQITSLSISA